MGVGEDRFIVRFVYLRGVFPGVAEVSVDECPKSVETKFGCCVYFSVISNSK